MTVQSYLRAELLPTSVEVGAGESTTILIPHVYPEFNSEIALAVNLRQTDLSMIPFITFTFLSDATEVYIDATGEDDGVFILILESFNSLALV